MADWQARTRYFYGWYMVAAMFVVLFFTGGAGFYVFPVYIGPLQQEFGWNMTQVSLAAGVWAIVFGLSGPLIGALIARIGLRRTMLVAAVLAGAVNLALSFLVNLWMLYAINLVAGFAVAGTTLVPGQTMVTNWFNRYRGRAMALALMGIGAGGFALPPLNEFLIRHWGWRPAFGFGCAVAWLVVVPLIAVFVRGRPAELGLLPDGEGPGETAAAAERGTPVGLSLKRAVRTPEFALLVTIYLLQLIGMSTLSFHFVPFANQEAGFTSQQAASYFGLAIGFSVLGKFGFGWLADRYDPARLQACTGLLMALGLLSVEVFVIRLEAAEAGWLWIYAAFHGVGFGGQVVVLPVLVSRCFGELHFSKIMGLVMSGFAAGILVGIPLAGWSFDVYRTYEPAFLTCIAMFLISAAAALLVRWKRYRAEFAAG
ncbi:MAG: MFS transporter [bacterium]|nr:MFS transporter [bacterium]